MYLKHKWAVMILDSKKYVTRVNNAEEMSYWEDGKPAKLMTRGLARDLAWGLTLNGNDAVVVEVPEDWGEFLCNPPKEIDGDKNNG